MTRTPPQPDTATDIAHDTFPTPTAAAPRRRRRSRAARSPSLTSSKRSPSPIVSFSPSAENAKGVKNITRKVIKTLEGLGHLDVVDMVTYEEGDEEERRVDREVEEVLYELEREEIRSAGAKPETNGYSHHLTTVNGNGNGALNGGSVDKTKKVDLEIPRKVLHASIGFFTLYLYISEGDARKITLALWTALAIIVPADLLRFRSQRFERTYERFLGFLMRESEKNSVNGVVWYILGVNFVLSLYPQDVATVAILILSWADTAASTFGRLYGSSTRKLPARLPLLRLPFAPRKSLAGFTAASITGAVIAVGFWSLVAPFRNGGRDVTWALEGGVRAAGQHLGGGGWAGLALIGLVAGVVSGVAEALDLGSLDDNLTLPIISGGCILGFLKLLGMVASWFS
ncbi:uncharacterized protein LACBIDRAFT_316889 [Laccaria bicolor S238N-H82]|uniref:Predicted protein n=1 Tax=Laccaria bicolor (strain S238N-H82 / ATCC MYA-4686) TaxID=486041 RepID=B0D573_LACBS|nr:uncharacterized protein LACBIDRAFT_316889 [Laccaria bicolor S238N-H82]EDR10466.1 predicted protein [Laccaria bicolor S238N-H82]|eukprot:XP_001878916.1 predicted protein [Laccaria bicolor S238N-H82]